jgi:RNA polymerase sigma factor (sigma-70 family)
MTTAHPTPIESLLAEQQWLHELARHLVRDPEAARDLEQETWLAALRSPPAHADGARGWLATVLRRLIQRRLESERHGRERETDVARIEALPGADAGAARAETVKALVEATLALEEPFRATVLARWFEGLEPRAIGERMGVPASTVRSRLVRAHAKLREALVGHVEEDDLFGLGWVALFGVAWRELRARWSVALPAAVAASVLVVAGLWVAGRVGVAEPGEVAPNGASQAAAVAGGTVELAALQAAPDEAATQVRRAVDGAAVEEAGAAAQAALAPATATGTVIARDGPPVAGARVGVWRSSGGPAALQIGRDEDAAERGSQRVLELVADSEGRFEVPLEFVGERADTATPYFVRCETPGFDDSTADLERGHAIELRPYRLVRFEGRVVEAASGRPLVDVAVDYGPGRNTTTTGADGRFAFDDLMAIDGPRVLLVHRDFAPASVPVSLAGAGPHAHEYALERGTPLDVRFVDAASGAPVGGVRIFAGREASMGLAADADGGLRVHLPESGERVLLGRAEGYAGFRWSLPGGTLESDAEVRVPMHALTTLEGRVVEADGRAVAGAHVMVTPVERAPAADLPGVPGTIAHGTLPERFVAEMFEVVASDAEGRFALGLFAGEGPWNALATSGKRRAWLGGVAALDAPLRLVLEPEIERLRLGGRLVRHGAPWTQPTWIELTGERADGAMSTLDGSFEVVAHGAGTFELVVADRVVRRVVASAAATELGDVELDGLPHLTLRCETPEGEPWAGADAWIHAVVPGERAEGPGWELPATALLRTLDAEGRCSALLPHAGEYVVRLSSGTVLAREVLALSGDVEHVLVADEPRTLELRLVDAASDGPVALDFDAQRFLAAWRRPGTLELTWSEVQSRGDGVQALSVPHGPLELLLRPGSAGYREILVDAARLAAADGAAPLEVRLERGHALTVELEGLERLPEGVDVYRLHESDLELVRPELAEADAARLAASGDLVPFLDARLSAQRLRPLQGDTRVELRGLRGGRHVLVAIDGHGRRDDVRVEPASFDVGPGVTSVRLTLAPR